jgi:hypothetical protein
MGMDNWAAFFGALLGALPALLAALAAFIQALKNHKEHAQQLAENTELTQEAKDAAIKASTDAEEHKRLCEEQAQELRALKVLLKTSLGRLLDPRVAQEYGKAAVEKAKELKDNQERDKELP